jgi:hypothetical protein
MNSFDLRTNSRAGWTISLAGEPGRRLEQIFGSAVAAALIYARSRPDKRIPDFYASDEVGARRPQSVCRG